MGLAPAPWPLCCFALHVAEQTDFLLGPVSVSPVVIERLNWHLGWPPPPSSDLGAEGRGAVGGRPSRPAPRCRARGGVAERGRRPGRPACAAPRAPGPGCLRRAARAPRKCSESGGAGLLSPAAQGKAGPVPVIAEAASATSRWGRAQLVLSKPSTAPHCLGGAGGDGALPVSVGALCGTAVTGLLVSDTHSTGRPKWLCSL